jgi:hypothetical protein
MRHQVPPADDRSMAHEEVVDEGPTGSPGNTNPSPSGGPGPPDLETRSCSDLQDLWDLTVVTIFRLEHQLEDTPKFRFLERRAILISMRTHQDLKASIEQTMLAKGCP